jgi:hypothetical protein
MKENVIIFVFSRKFKSERLKKENACFSERNLSWFSIFLPKGKEERGDEEEGRSYKNLNGSRFYDYF